MEHKEQPIYLYHAVLLMVRRKEIDWTSKAPPVDTPIADVEKLYRDCLGGGKMEIDYYNTFRIEPDGIITQLLDSSSSRTS